MKEDPGAQPLRYDRASEPCAENRLLKLYVGISNQPALHNLEAVDPHLK